MFQVPLSLVALANVWVCLDLPVDATEHWKTKLKRVDFLGAGILVFGISALMLGLDFGVSHTWDSPITITLLTISPVLLGVFLLVETSYAKEPVAPPSVLFNRTSLACLICNFCSYGAWLALIYYLPLYWQAVEGLSATSAGLRLLPGIGAVVCGSLSAGLVHPPTLPPPPQPC